MIVTRVGPLQGERAVVVDSQWRNLNLLRVKIRSGSEKGRAMSFLPSEIEKDPKQWHDGDIVQVLKQGTQHGNHALVVVSNWKVRDTCSARCMYQRDDSPPCIPHARNACRIL